MHMHSCCIRPAHTPRRAGGPPCSSRDATGRRAQVADAASEAKANVRCLETLGASLAPLASGAPRQALAALPALLSAVHAMRTVSRRAPPRTALPSRVLWRAWQPAAAPCNY